MSNLCILPWISLETSPLGTVRPCCLNTQELRDVDRRVIRLKEVTLSDAFKSPDLKSLRESFIKDERPVSCRKCWDEEDAGRVSKRMNSINRLRNLIGNIDFTKTDGELIFLDLKLGNICNLKCRICGSYSSSKWAQEEILIQGNNYTAKRNLELGRWPQETNLFWQDLHHILPGIRYLELTGGEPFLIQEHFDLLRYAVDNGYAKDIELHYNTNGTQLPKEGFELWPHFKTVEIAFSVDDVGKRFEYQRYGAKWNQVKNNVEQFVAFKKQHANIVLQTCTTVNVFNFYYLDDVCKWISEQGFDFIYFNVLHEAWYYSIKSLNAATKKMINTKYAAYDGPYKDEITNLLAFMNKGIDTECTALVGKIRDSDVQRKQRLTDDHRELAEAIGY